tara:strand:- start:95 stop:490 length:396 start_codon:yes stop_codon:yes gene_type:complete
LTEENDSKVIQGPWPKSGRKVKVPDDGMMQLQDDIAFAEELNQTVIVQMIHTMGENGIHVTEESFIKDIGFIIEVTKGVIYRSMGIPYPTQKLLEVFVNTELDADKSLRSEVDLEQLNKFLKMCKEEEYDE